MMKNNITNINLSIIENVTTSLENKALVQILIDQNLVEQKQVSGFISYKYKREREIRDRFIQ